MSKEEQNQNQEEVVVSAVLVSANVFIAIRNYLETKPYNEVSPLLDGLAKGTQALTPEQLESIQHILVEK